MRDRWDATPGLIADFFELADEIDDQVDRMMEAVAPLLGTLFAVVAPYLRSVLSDDVRAPDFRGRRR